MKNFNKVIPLLRSDEGDEYTNDPNDSGGPTKYGITLTDYRQHINENGVALDVKKMTWDQAETIYKEKYWDALDCDNLPAGVDYTCFDYGVNSGLGRPRKALDKFKSLSGTDLIDAINNERTAFLKALVRRSPKDQEFLKGWLARVERVRATSKDLFNQKNNVVAPAVAAGGFGLFGAVSQFIHTYETPIIVGGIVLSLVVAYAVHKLINKGKNDY